jgi:hypothetical protein
MRALGVGALVALLFAGSPVVAAERSDPTANMTFQKDPLPPFERSKTYLVFGEKVRDGCSYTYPEFVVPADVDHWQVRDVGIDPKRCIKLVEEGIPTVEETKVGDASASLFIGAQTASPSGGATAAASSVASGYSTAWTEDAAGWHVSEDKTWISWAYNATCVTSGSSSGEWTWIAGTGWGIVSGTYGGTNNLSCSRFYADTWSTMKNNSFFLCPWATFYTYYYHVRAYGWNNGTITGARSTQVVTDGICLPLWSHYDVKKTG